MADENPLAGRAALVTGGARRVGRAVALTLAQAGLDVAITYRTSGDEAQQVVAHIQSLGRRAVAIHADLADPHAADGLFVAYCEHFDNLHALVNNASVFDRTPFDDLAPEQFDVQMAVNARSPLMLTQRFAAMLAEGADADRPHTLGRVVNFVDAHVLGQPMRDFAAYSASKAALLEITRCAARELAPRVTVNAVAPGVVAWAEPFTLEQRQRYLQRVPLGRAGTPADAAAAVLYLVRDAHYTTGQVLRLDGGRSLT